MNQNSSFKSKSEKYNIAWFKLAEFVSRGEKERALGIYKLLTLSINNPALICQLEGDILLAFNDINAINHYVKAAKLYQQEGKLIEAVSIYEHLLTLKPESLEFYNILLELYTTLNFTDKLIYTLKRVLTISLNNTSKEIIFGYTKQVVEKYFNENDTEISIFISKLEILQPDLYADLMEYLELPKEKNENNKI